ncbi:DUF3870 domain-containing protein [Thermoanaerobacterium sp. RBIITD]|uniref:DUF3870 domain-containing protein n=1 Tax=Thermoanaerobacterium sp. RBIITD TaxID=1550240 RepID=UPI000BB7E328|nr:DUF3870 domain-containing protein [Thermoanaerobacterium sp. RBIITD]SNX54295.1 protein of unknown function [Thermoanaerobacterium sp. RBIITD]
MVEDKYFITGYAKLPDDITARELYTVLAVGLIVHSKSGIIEDADCTLATSAGKSFFKMAVIGKNIHNIDDIISIFEKQYFGQAKKAIIAALKMCNTKYCEIE